MPELPEVETIVRGIEKAIVPSIIKNIVKSEHKLRIDYPRDFVQNLTGATILKAHRVAKYIVLDTDGGDSIIIHLGMSGRLLVMDSLDEKRKHDHVIFQLSNGKSLIYNDPRRFGLVTLVKTQDMKDHILFKRLGVDPFSKQFNLRYFCSKVCNKNIAIKSVLMDGRFITGVGNIYANEALYLAKISPFKKAGELNSNEIKRLIKSIREVLNKGIEMGGSSLKDYRAPDGTLGNFQNYFQVYGRANQKCFSCDALIVRQLLQQRATFYCPNCERNA